MQELALAVHKRGIYPATHPMLRGSVEALARRFHAVLLRRSQISVGVSRHRLVVDGVVTDENNSQLADLAERLYEHELGVVTFFPDLQRGTLEEFIGAISVSPARSGDALGAGGRAQLERWHDIALTRLAFDRLEIMESRGEDARRELKAQRFAELWLALTRVTLAGGSLEGSIEDPAELARSIDRHVRDDEYNHAVFGFLRQLVVELDDGGMRDPVLRSRVSQLIQSLDDATLAKLLRMGGDTKASADFLQRSCNSLAAEAVVVLTRGAATNAGVPIAGSMLRLLSKLAREADSRRPMSRRADRALRGVIRRMLAGWKLIDPNPEAYTEVLNEIATAGGEALPDLGRDGCEAERMLQIGVASGSLGVSVEAALARLVANHGVAAAVDCLMTADPSPLRDSLIDRLINESTFRDELALPRPALAVLEHAVARLGGRAVGPLVQELERREDNDAPWLVELLTRIGAAAIPVLGDSLSALSPRALRHVLVVFDRCDCWPPDVDPLSYARHRDPGVRREAIRFVLKRDVTREQGILAALRDPDIRIFNLALGAMPGACSIEVARAAVSRLESPELSDELRARGIRALADAPYDEVREWLERRATVRRLIFRTLRLRKPSLELFAILSVLATRAGDSPALQRVLALARASRNQDVRRAATQRVLTQSPT